MKINHIGIITADIKKSIMIYSKMGFESINGIVIDNYQNNYVSIMKSCMGIDIELIEPISSLSSIYNFNEGYHHICFEAEHGEDIVKEFNQLKVGKIFTRPICAPAFYNREVVFACLQNGMLIELMPSYN